MHLPGFGPKRARRLYDELGIDSLEALRAAAERQEIRGAARLRREGRGEAARDARASRPTAARPRASCSRARSTIAEQIVGALRAHPAADRVEVAGSLRRLADSVKDLDIIATAQDPSRWSAALAELPLVESVLVGGRRRRARDHALGHEGRPQGRRARPVRQRAPALHRLQGAQRGAARGRGAARAARLASTGSSTTRPARRCAARPRRRSTSGSACRGSRPSCARAAASSRRRLKGELPQLRDAGGPARRPALPHDALRRPPDARADGRGRAARAATSTSRSPTTRPRTASATTSRPRRCEARIERGRARSTRKLDGFELLAGTEVEHPPGRLARLRRTSCSRGSTG